ncbi:MAG: apolipoprotein N-acyltransferase [Flavobacteriales bacterium]|nr:apolipoprotein N-acyltransferase [Flavobacteriales bacterium]
MVPSRSLILLWAATSGVLWALAWPGIGGFAPLAFVAWLPLLHAERLHDQRTAGRPRAFVPYALLAVFIWNASTSWWFFCVSEPIGTRLISGFAPMVVNSSLMIIPWWMKRLVHRAVDPRTAAYGFMFFWLSFEYLHHDWDLQWPWFSIGNVFAEDPAWIQWYEYSGTLGGTAWVLLFTFFADHAVSCWTSRTRRAWVQAVLAATTLALPLMASVLRFRTYPVNEGRTIEAVVVQPCVDPYTEKFGGLDPMMQLDAMLALAEGVMTDSTALVVMPETALQEGAMVDLSGPEPIFHGLWENELGSSRSARRLAAFQGKYPSAVILAGMSAEYLYPRDFVPPVSARPVFRLMPGDDERQRWYEAYNAAMFLPSSGPLEHYNKSKLVAGVELMPFEAVLGHISALSVDLGGTSGSLGTQEERAVLKDKTHALGLIPAICYESVFGEHIAAHVRNGGNLIAIITNDGWWADSPGYRQHLSFASIRAIESRRDVVRSANTGISCFVDRTGVIHQATPWWVPTAIRGSVHLNNELTFYVRHGDQLGRVAIVFAVLLLLLSLARLVKKRSAL